MRGTSRLVNQVREAGKYTINFNAINLSCGIYFYNINADGFKGSKKMVLVKLLYLIMIRALRLGDAWIEGSSVICILDKSRVQLIM